MSRIIIYPFSMASQSSKDLRDRLGAVRVYPDGNYRPREDDLIINWGMGREPEWFSRVTGTFLNDPACVNVAGNKLLTLQKLQACGISIPRFTTDREVADNEFRGIVVRHSLREHSGRGIELVRLRGQEIPQAPLYTELIESIGEYRVHVFDGMIIDYIKKRREYDDEPEDDERYIRSHNNGWIFTRENLRWLGRIEQLALDSVESLGLDFGAVDIVKDKSGRAYTLEVNTAVSMEGQTLENYVNAIRNHASI